MRVGELSLDVSELKLMITNGTLGPRDFHGGSLCHHKESLSSQIITTFLQSILST